MKAVLVHGIFSTHRIFSSMKRLLEKNGFDCFVPDLKPSDGRSGLDDLGRKLKDKIDSKLGTSGKFVLVGFSMGGIIARYYLQYLDGASRVDYFFSISAPNHGTILAYLYPGKGAKQLRPHNAFLKDLNENQSMLESIKLYSYWTPFDLSIIPAGSSQWDLAENKKFYSLLHPLMLFNKSVAMEIIFQIYRR